MRTFETGARRDTDLGKLDYEGFLSPLALKRFAQYMNKNRKLADGSLRDSDNWQKGIPQDAYMKSGWRHFFEWWEHHRDVVELDTDAADTALEEALCALLFNVQGYLHEHLKAKRGQAEPAPKLITHKPLHDFLQKAIPWPPDLFFGAQSPNTTGFPSPIIGGRAAGGAIPVPPQVVHKVPYPLQ